MRVGNVGCPDKLYRAVYNAVSFYTHCDSFNGLFAPTSSSCVTMLFLVEILKHRSGFCGINAGRRKG